MGKKILSREKYGAIFDAHVHLYFDLHDALMSPLQLIKKTIKLGFNWVNAMTHDSIRGISRVKKLARSYNLPVIPSMEISTAINHILAFGVQEWNLAKDSWDPIIVIEELRRQDCAIYLSHPFLNPVGGGKWTPEIVKRLDIDGIEYVNGSAQFLNRINFKWFKNYPKGKIAGTDAHHPSQMGYSYTQVYTNSTDPDDLVSALKKGKCRPLGRYVPLHRLLLWNIAIISKKKFFPTYHIENKWIYPNTHKMGWEMDKFYAEKWQEKILDLPIKTDF